MNKDLSLKQITPEATLSQITEADKNAAEMLASIGLDITQHKHDTLRSVCQQQQWSESEVLQWIKKHRSNDLNRHDESNIERTLTEWCDYLEEEYHASHKNLLTKITDDFQRVQKIEGTQYEWLKDINWNYNQLEEKLRMHYWFKEQTFYPLVARLHNRRNNKVLHGTVHKIERALRIIETDQNQLVQTMDIIREKGKDFAKLTEKCSTLLMLNQDIKTLFESLHHQFWLEEEYLLPKLRSQLRQIN